MICCCCFLFNKYLTTKKEKIIFNSNSPLNKPNFIELLLLLLSYWGEIRPRQILSDSFWVVNLITTVCICISGLKWPICLYKLAAGIMHAHNAVNISRLALLSKCSVIPCTLSFPSVRPPANDACCYTNRIRLCVVQYSVPLALLSALQGMSKEALIVIHAYIYIYIYIYIYSAMLVFRSFQALNHTVCHFSHTWFNSQNRVMSFWLALMPRVHFNETHTIVQPWAVKRHISPWHIALCSHNSLISNCFTPDRWVHKFPHAANINTNNSKCCFKNEGLHENTHDVTWLGGQVQDVAVSISDWRWCTFNMHSWRM